MNLDYNNTVPATNDNPSDDQPEMLINAISIGQWVNIDHYGFGSNTGGQHQQCTLISQASVPASRTVGMGTLYTKTLSSRGQLFYTNDNSGNEYQMTRCSDANFSTFGTFTLNYAGPKPTSYQGGWTFLPGGLFFQYGEVVANGSSSYTVPFPVSFNTLSIVVTVSPACDDNSANAVNISSVGVQSNQFTVFTTTSSHLKVITWTAVGL